MVGLTTATLGQNIRAARLGYHWHTGLEAFVRVSDDPRGFRIDVADPDFLMKEKGPGEYRVWWDTPVEPLLNDVLRTLYPYGFAIGRGTRFVDDRGQEVSRKADSAAGETNG